MTIQTSSQKCLGGSRAGFRISRLCTPTFAVIVATCGAVAGFAQAQPEAAKPAKTVEAAEPEAKIVGGYMVHQSIEVGGRITNRSGSSAMWDTLVNQGSGGRVLGQSLEMHSVNNSKTPFFDSLSTFSNGYGGDPIDVTRLRVSKGRWYDFDGSFRRDRQYFDYNLLDNSLLGPTALVPEPDSLHLFNTVRRNTDTNLTILPLSFISFRAAFNHGTHEGPSYTTAHEGGDVQLLQWFRNGADTYTGGVDVKVARHTTLSYDQLYVLYKGDSSFELAGANYPILNGNGAVESLGVDTLATVTCGTGASKSLEVVNGVANPYCSGSTVQSQSAPTRTAFPTEQLRFSSHYWERISMNGHFSYSGGVSNVNSFNETFTGLLARTFSLQEIDTGGLTNGGLAHNKRINVSADYGFEVELSKYISVSDIFNYRDFRTSGSNAVTSNVWAGTATTPNLNILTPLSAVTLTTTTTPNFAALNQKNSGNTILGIISVTPQFKFSGGWRFNARNITDGGGDDLSWHQNGLLLGAVLQPSRAFRFNVNYDSLDSKSSNAATTPSDTYTREAPNRLYHLRARASVKPAKWINFAIAGNDYSARNDDPLVNHFEHNHDLSFAASIIPTDALSLDFNYAHDDVFSETDLCYISTAPLPGAANAGTCVPTASNPSATSTLFLGNGYYHAPVNFISAGINYSPSKFFRFNGGARVNSVQGQAEQLSPLMVPGALESKFVTPFADLQINIASQWAWHGNWQHNGYSEGGPVGSTAPRDTHGNTVTLGVKYAF